MSTLTKLATCLSIISLLAGSAVAENRNCPISVKIFSAHPEIFLQRTFSVLRDGDTGAPQAIRLSKVPDGSILDQHNLRRGDIITEFCGTPISEALEPFNSPICCSQPYPEIVTLKVYRSLIEQFHIQVAGKPAPNKSINNAPKAPDSQTAASPLAAGY